MKAESFSLFIVCFRLFFYDAYCETPQKVIRKISASFGQTIWECRKEVAFSLDVIEEFKQYWLPSYTFQNPELGCVTTCMLVKLQLVDQNNKVLEKNTIGFAKANYADDRMARQLLSYWSGCHRSSETNGSIAMHSEPCAVGLAIAKCFRRVVMQHHYEPTEDIFSYDDEYAYE